MWLTTILRTYFHMREMLVMFKLVRQAEYYRRFIILLHYIYIATAKILVERREKYYTHTHK